MEKKKLPQKAAESAQATLESWKRILASVDELSLDELQALMPEVYKVSEATIADVKAGRSSTRDARRLQVVIGKLLTRIGHRMKGG